MRERWDSQEFEKIVSSAAEQGLLHGAVVAAGRKGSLELLRAWGDAAVRPERRAMSVDAIFDVASVTKAVATASACAICIDKGLLDPDAPAREYLPKLGELKPGSIKVRDIATHTSGIDNFKFDIYEPDQMIDKIIEAPAKWQPRERYQYSCRGFILLGHIVELLSGQRLDEFCWEHLFHPLGMTQTRFGPIKEDLSLIVPTQVAAGLIADEQARKANRPIGNAGLFTNAKELATFCQMMLNDGKCAQGQIFQKRSLDWLREPCQPEGLQCRSFGWDMSGYPFSPHRPTVMSIKAFGHSGWTGQSVWIDPVNAIYAIVLTNRNHAPKPGAGDTHRTSMVFRGELSDWALKPLLA